ncbi:MAG: GGDEF domain-containing protein, partial [Oscillospiraceae bacterium]|nr:GGDEF domain-containing protein [Oscillospiraceae bacterium]
ANIEHYVKLDELSEENETLGIIIDVTEETVKRLQIEAERDIDLLTGLYNRRGLENRLEELFSDPVQLDCGAMIMIDADGLKEINDKYGHDKGDIYLKKIAEMLGTIGSRNSVTSREGGDEFVLFLYGYSDEKELLDDLDTLKYTQSNSSAQLGDDIIVPLNFSYGYSLTEGHSDYRSLMKDADERMYESKRERKKLLKQT